MKGVTEPTDKQTRRKHYSIDKFVFIKSFIRTNEVAFLRSVCSKLCRWRSLLLIICLLSFLLQFGSLFPFLTRVDFTDVFLAARATYRQTIVRIAETNYIQALHCITPKTKQNKKKNCDKVKNMNNLWLTLTK